MDQQNRDNPMSNPTLGPGPRTWQRRWYEVIFEHDTPAGRRFDVLLLIVIVVSVVAVSLESVKGMRESAVWGSLLTKLEWFITGLFTIELIARLACVNRPARYVFSFFGVVDIVSLLPSFLGIFLPGAQSLATIRTLRLLRVFRVLKLAHHVRESQGWLLAIRKTWPKITVFITVILCTIVVLGSIMYLIEAGADSGFDNIPVSIYWAIVTMTTVGYGDIAPVTPQGKAVASLVMLLGYAIIIVPTGLFSAEVMSQKSQQSARKCEGCNFQVTDPDAIYCSRCGNQL
ncbi:ion transporter [Aeoliella mucimassa]|nr:ion transporter [Aeoliella mucimassa]